MNKSILAFLLTEIAICAFADVPSIIENSVTMDQNPRNRRVTINYTLANADAIVTVDIRTNGVSIGGGNLRYFAGDVNKVVSPGPRTMTWLPDKAWEGHKIDSGVTAVVTAWATNTPPDYMVISLMTPKDIRYYTCAESLPHDVTNALYKTEELVMRKIPAGNVRWLMGSPTTALGYPTTEQGRGNDEIPHLVTLSSDYYIGVFPVTQRQYELVMMRKTSVTAAEKRPSQFKLESDYATRPVDNISYETLRGSGDDYNWPVKGHDVKSDGFLGLLRTCSGLKGIDLPTAAQWEFACRAGNGSALYNGEEITNNVISVNLDSIGRYAGNGGRNEDGNFANAATAPTTTAEHGSAMVGTFPANPWGLYDMLGNMLEWCLDWYDAYTVSGYDAETGPVSSSSSKREMRGGNWSQNAQSLRCAYRFSFSPSGASSGFGFRIACPIPGTVAE